MTAKAQLIQAGDQATIVNVSVGKQYPFNVGGANIEVEVILNPRMLLALIEATINQNIAGGGLEPKLGTRDLTGRAEKAQSHQ